MSTVSNRKLDPGRLKKARESRFLTQEDLARKARCSVFMVGKCERGERTPSDGLLRRWAKATRKPVSFFYVEAEVAA